jgi:hypothetical protein
MTKDTRDIQAVLGHYGIAITADTHTHDPARTRPQPRRAITAGAPNFFRTAEPSRVVWNGEWLCLSNAGSSRPSLRTRRSSW